MKRRITVTSSFIEISTGSAEKWSGGEGGGGPSALLTAKKIRFMYVAEKKVRGLSPNFHIYFNDRSIYFPAVAE
jgi:hypothetical protein